jgi:transposase-like protein
MEPSQSYKVRASYSAAFKKKAIRLAKKSPSATAAARQLKIPVANLYYWLRAKKGEVSHKKNKPNMARKAKARRTYSPEFKLHAVQRVTKTNGVAAVARELKIAVQTLHNWIEAAKAGRIGTTITFTLEEMIAVENVCAHRIIDLKKMKAVNPKSATGDLKVLIAASAKLKRLNQ